MSEITEIKKKGNNIDKLSGIFPLIPRELKIKFI